MIKSINYSLGNSYLQGIVDNAARPFVARSRTARLLGYSNAQQRRWSSAMRFQAMQSFSYLDRQPGFPIQNEYHPVQSSVAPLAETKLHEAYREQKNSDQKQAMKPIEKTTVPIDNNAEINTAKPNRWAGDNSELTDLHVSKTQHGQDNRVEPDAVANLDKPAIVSLVQTNDQKSRQQAKEQRHPSQTYSDHQYTESNAQNPADLNPPKIDKSGGKRSAKQSFLNDLGRQLEASNFPDEVKLAQISKNSAAVMSRTEHSTLAQSDEQIEYRDMALEPEKYAEQLKTLKQSFIRRYYGKSNSTSKLEKTDSGLADKDLNVSFAQLKGPSRANKNHQSSDSHNAGLQTKHEVSDVKRAQEQQSYRKINTGEQAISTDAEQVAEAKPLVQRETVVIERNVQQSVFSEISDAFWERSYLGHRSLRLYK